MGGRKATHLFKETIVAKKKKPAVPKRSKVLQEVRENPLFAHKVEKSKKGRGSYRRERVSRGDMDGCQKLIA